MRIRQVGLASGREKRFPPPGKGGSILGSRYSVNATGWEYRTSATAADGLRAFFRFRFAHKDSTTDSRGYSGGFTFATLAWTDGTAPCGGSGDCLGYAGIAGPKSGVEFDVYPNQSRNDYSYNNHIAGLYRR